MLAGQQKMTRGSKLLSLNAYQTEKLQTVSDCCRVKLKKSPSERTFTSLCSA